MCIRDRSLRLVTLEGDLINPGGSMTGGAFKNSSNLLSRRREIEEFEKTVAMLKSDTVSYTHLDVYKRQELCETCGRRPLRRRTDRGAG